MPIYEYQAKDESTACDKCRVPFEVLQRLSDPRVRTCAKCGAELVRLISAPAIGPSASGLDHRAKDAGFHKLKRLGKGEYEKTY